MYENLSNKLKVIAPKSSFLEKEPMKYHTTFRVGGPADVFAYVDSIEAFGKIIAYCYSEGIPHTVIGNGSNVLVTDKGIRGVVISMAESQTLSGRLIYENIAFAGGGALMSTLANECAKSGLSGLEFASGIPGSIGGGVYMNAGAYGGCLADVITSVRVVSPEGLYSVVPIQMCNMGYRDTRFMHTGEYIVGADFRLKKDDPKKIFDRMRELNEQRRAKQPLEYASAGSTFKRPEGYFAGKLIEDAGLKGLSVGDASVSEKHAGFIINKGNATASDILELIEMVRERVYDVSGVTLEPEVRILGE